jgi:hypothetical protein
MGLQVVEERPGDLELSSTELQLTVGPSPSGSSKRWRT